MITKPTKRVGMASESNAAEAEQATGTDAKNDQRAAFLQASATLLLNISPPLESSLPPPSADVPTSANAALLLLAQSVMEAQAPRPTFSDFASVPADNPFGSPPVGDS